MIRYKGRVKALSAIQHNSDEVMSTDSLLRRTKITDIDGKIKDVPFITGNSIRGRLRRLAFKHLMLFLAGKEEGDLKDHREITAELGISNLVYYTLFTGGNLRKTSEGDGKLLLEKQKDIREKLPMLSLLGTAIGNQMVDGKLKVADVMPICKETYTITGVEEEKTSDDLVEDRFFTRHDDLDKAEKDKKEEATQMKYNVEVLVPGTQFVHEFGLEMTTKLENSAFGFLMSLWKESPYVGGRSSVGHGKIEFKYEPDFEDGKLYLDFLKENKEKLLEYLKGMK